MPDDSEERWMELCRQAAVEQDSDRLLELVREINQLLEQKSREIQSPSVNRPLNHR